MRRLIAALICIAAVSWSVLATQHDPSIKAGTAARLGVSDMASKADLVIEGQIQDSNVVVGETGLIETEYLLSVDRTFWGADLGSRTVRLPGGVLPDGSGMMIPGMPKLSVGEDVLLFLAPESEWGMRMPMGLSQGKFRIVTNFSGERRLVRDDSPLHFVDPVTGELQEGSSSASLDYAAVVAEIHAALATRLAGPAQPVEETEKED